MSLIYVFAFSLAGLLIGWSRPRKYTTGILLALSVLSVYWLQPLTPLRYLDFWLPTASIALTILVWALTYSGDDRSFRQMAPGIAIIFLMIIFVAGLRYLTPICCLTPARPPSLVPVLVGLSILFGLSLLCFRFNTRTILSSNIIVAGLIVLFVLQKNGTTSEWTSASLRFLTGQSPELAAPSDLSWLGFSFIAFRLIHAALDQKAKRLPAYPLDEFAAYVLFFPALLAGPIDRSQHFIQELHRARSDQDSPDCRQKSFENTITGLQRILIGVFKKVVLADSLAYFALNSQNAIQTNSGSWLWILLLSYSLRIYFDFSGYTDIAIGSAVFMGIKLPENFNWPYTKTNLTAFWNSWHISLAQWFRSYVFFPVTRTLRTRKNPPPTWLVILIGQIITMSLIGIWHGITWNFLIWGLWHGFGLFFQNRWSEWSRNRLEPILENICAAMDYPGVQLVGDICLRQPGVDLVRSPYP